MGRTVRSLCVGFGALLLAGCWPMPGANPDRTSYNPLETIIDARTVGNLTEQWRWTSPAGQITDPVTSAGGVHVQAPCLLVTLDPGTGAQRWTGAVTDPAACEAVPGAIIPDNPYVLDTASGQRVWGSTHYDGMRRPLIQPQYSDVGFDVGTGANPSPGPGVVVAARGDSRVTTNYQLTGPVSSQGTLTVDGRTFTVDSGPATGVTLGADLLFQVGGGTLATAPGNATFGNGVRGYSRTDARPGCGPITFPFQNTQMFVECPVWATPTDGPASIPVLSPDGTTLFTRTTAGTLYALDAATGAVRWTATGLGDGGKPALAQDAVWVPTGDGQVLPFAAAGCGAPTCGPSLPWHVDTGTGRKVSAVTVAGDVVYAVSAGHVYAVTACQSGACSIAWSGAGAGSPVVSNGRLYVTDGNATLITYGVGS